MSDTIHHTISANESGKRIDRVLAFAYPQYSRSVLAGALSSGSILLDGRVVRPKTIVFEGMLCKGSIPSPSKEQLLPDTTLQFTIFDEDEHCVIIEKPVGIAVHPSPGSNAPSVASWFLAQYPKSASVGENPLRPGIVHRLDKETSGVMVLAKTDEMFTFLKQQFQDRTVNKRYLVVAYGHLPHSKGVIRTHIVRSSHDPTKMTIGKDGEGREAETFYKMLEQHEHPFPVSLLEIHPTTGRMHQIRVHLHSLGHPVVGDMKYTRKEFAENTTLLPPSRMLLHAHQLEFLGMDGAPRRTISPQPEAFSLYLESFTG